jgi:hypothetical protein
MSGAAWKKPLEAVLVDLGFSRVGKSYRRLSPDAAVLFSIEKGFGAQWHFNVGFWLSVLGATAPDRVEASHLYLRLERLFPAYRDTILAAGATDEAGQLEALDRLCILLRDSLNPRLRELATIDELRRAVQSGQLNAGMMRKEAREYLSAG